ncbi:MATE family efflux transporter [Methylobacterium planeticum]|uniref:MATE family efflux transporter n=1 Tax=Methylobacterium planeticum TaxID=2615211 RepID=A0A6N6MW97_9HYPH|nr:MATE family efflux transporter [Methylobacterium planeticum]KAB1074883.1 MATE family efflux transporter [Methylobacterium planeticum]
MTALGLAASAARGRAPFGGPWMGELGATLSLAAPLVLTNLAQHALMATDVVLLGRLGAPEVAAGALATSLYFVLFICGIGLTAAVSPLIAGALGRDRNATDEVRRIVRSGVWAVGLVTAPLMLLLWHTGRILAAIGEPAELASAAGTYMRALQWSMAPALLFMVLRASLSALQRPVWPLLVSVATLPVNVGLALWLAFEGPGRIGLGPVGVGLATTLASLFSLGALVAIVLCDRHLRPYRAFARLWHFDAGRLASLFRLGLPMAATGLAEAGLFEAAVLGMGLFGTAQLAAHAVVIQIAAFCFMVPNGVAQAATVRVGLAYGARDGEASRRAGKVALGLGFGFMALCAVTQLSVPQTLIGLFLDLSNAQNASVLPYATGFLGLAALFAIADGVQSVALGMLRGLQDTRVPMLIALFGYWGIGVPSGIALAWGFGVEGYGIWIGFCAGLFVVSVLLVARWRRLVEGGLTVHR